MKLVELMKRANTFYSDGSMADYFGDETGEFKENELGSDTLARSVVSNLEGMYDESLSDTELLGEAVRVVHSMLDDLIAVLAGLDGNVCWQGLKKEEA